MVIKYMDIVPVGCQARQFEYSENENDSYVPFWTADSEGDQNFGFSSPKDKLRLDLLYIRNYSLLLDIKIILRTIQVIFMKEKSRGLSEDKFLQKLLESMDFNVYNEMGVTVIDKR